MLSWFDQNWALNSREKRVHRRLGVQVPAQVRLSPDRSVPGRLTEVSPEGFRLASGEPLPLNTRLFVVLEGELRFPAQILWNRRTGDGRAPVESGGRFGLLGKAERFSLAERFFSGPGIDLADVTERRRHIRVLRQATIGEETLVIRDLSESGLGLLSRHPYRVGEEVEVRLNLSPTPIPAAGRVVSCVAVPENRYYRVGVAFLAMEEPFRRHLVRALAEMMKRQTRP